MKQNNRNHIRVLPSAQVIFWSTEVLWLVHGRSRCSAKTVIS